MKGILIEGKQVTGNFHVDGLGGESFVHFVSRSCIPEYLAVYPRPLPGAMYPSLKSLLIHGTPIAGPDSLEADPNSYRFNSYAGWSSFNMKCMRRVLSSNYAGHVSIKRHKVQVDNGSG